MPLTVKNSSRAFAVICCVIASTTSTSTQVASQRTAPQTTGLERLPIIASSKLGLVVIGAADAATVPEAEANSYMNAVYRAATEFNARLFEDARAPLSVSFADLEDYVRRFGRVTGKQTTPPVKGRLRGYTRLEIHYAFLDPVRIRTMTTSSKLTSRQAEGYLLAPAARLAERAATEILIRRVPVHATTPRNGSFQFVFALRAARGRVIARLERIEVEEDGSAGDATWAFTVTASGGGTFVVPSQRYNRDRPSVPLSSDEKTREVTFSVSRPNLELRVLGERR
jgi:hypothetical protein